MVRRDGVGVAEAGGAELGDAGVGQGADAGGDRRLVADDGDVRGAAGALRSSIARYDGSPP